MGTRELGLVISREKSELKNDAHYAQLLKLYDLRLKQKQLSDYDDLLLDACRLLEHDNGLQKRVRETFRFVFVDEFQDTNRVQYQLLRLINPLNLFVIGDELQAIYSFRGSDATVFDSFLKDYRPEVITLDENYRSAPEIVRAGSALFPEAVQQKAVRGGHGEVTLVKTLNEFTEAEWITARIEALLGGLDLNHTGTEAVSGKIGFSDFGILYRVHGAGRAVADKIIKSGMPYQQAGDKGIFGYPLIDFISKLLGFMHEKNDRSFERLLQNKFMKLEPGVIARLMLFGHEHFSAAVENKQLKNKTVLALSGLLDQGSTSAAEIAASAVELFNLRGEAAQLNARNSAFTQFENLLEKFDGEDTLQQFADYYDQLEGNDFIDERADKISLLTVHAAKGLEFRHVFICGFEDGLIPFTRYQKTEAGLLEEKRLFYVALTRAGDNLYLMQAANRNRQRQEQSRYLPLLKDIRIVEDENSSRIKKKLELNSERKKQLKMF
jgi:DNA helicase-2/ATP-dependent DNA helicase PcrA